MNNQGIQLELKLLSLFLIIGLIPLLVTAGIFYYSTDAFKLVKIIPLNIYAILMVMMVFVLFSGYSMVKAIAYSFRGYIFKLNQVALGNQDLAGRTQEQATALEQMVATVEEVNALIRQTTVNAGLADRISQSTLETVKVGDKAIQDNFGNLRQLFSSSKQIAEIIEVVNDIALQINILAINAAVEAVSAGEQGKGFAVVAVEVKNLARRTAIASREIEKLVKENIGQAEQSSILIGQSAGTLRQIVKNTQQTNQVIKQVSLAMQEQAVATQQIDASICQLNQITQQNAAMIEDVFTDQPNTKKFNVRMNSIFHGRVNGLRNKFCERNWEVYRR